MRLDALMWHSLLFQWDAWALTLLLVIGYPSLGYFASRRFQTQSGPVPRGGRLRLYSSMIASEWVLAGATIWVCRRHGLNMASLGQRIGDIRVVASTSLFLLAAALILIFRSASRRATPTDRPGAVFRTRRGFLPTRPIELALFSCLALSAGICEEWTYRGWLVTFLSGAVGSLWVAVGVGGAVFAFAHVYQGPRGMKAAGIFGTFLGVLFVLTGTLLPGQILHSAINLLNGLIGGGVLSRQDRLRKLGHQTPLTPPAESS